MTANCSIASRGGQGDPASTHSGLYFGHGPSYIDVAGGFQNEFSMFYSSITSTTVKVWDGFGGTGAALATLVLAPNASEGVFGPNCSSYAAIFCPYFAASLSFAGTAKSVSFVFPYGESGFDDVRFGSAQLVAPEPSSALLVAGGLLGLVGIARRRLPRV